MAGSTAKSDNFVLLDGLRGLGALFVLYGHTAQYWSPYWPLSAAVMVDLFFLLSGFVIAYSYEPRLKTGMRLGEFMTHRLVRLFPLYILGTVIGFVILCSMTIGDHDGGPRALEYTAQLIPQLFMMPAPEVLGSEYPYSLNHPAWTLFFELAVNLVYVLAFRWLTTKKLIVVTALCAVALIITVMVFGRIDAGSEWKTFWGGFARAGFGFFAGVLVYRLVGSPRQATRPASRWSLAIMLVIPFVCFIPATQEMRPYVDIFLAVGLGIPLLWLCQSIAPPDRFTRLFLVGGRISYAVYILHWPFRDIADRIAWRTPLIHEFAPLGGIAILIVAVGLSYFAKKYYDRPLRRWFVGMLKARAARRTAVKPPNASFAE